MKNLPVLVLSISFIAIPSTAMSCDSKSCEKAYLASTSQYIENHGRQAQTARAEREAHALNRERRDYAVQDHIHRIQLFLSK